MRALAKDVCLSIPNTEGQSAQGHKELAEEAAKGEIFSLSLCDVAREKAKDGIGKRKEIKDPKHKGEDGVQSENAPKKNKDEGEDKGSVIKGIGAVSSRKKAGKAIAEAIGTGITHKILPLRG